MYTLNIGINLETECYQYYLTAYILRDVLKSSIETYIYGDLPTLIACFSHEGDKLSQWRAYGDDGTGVALGFDANTLALLRNEKMNILVDDVVYSKEKQLKIIKNGVSELIQEFKKGFNGEDNFMRIRDFKEYLIDGFDEFCDLLCEWLSNMASYIKNPAFSEENEFRISYNPGFTSEVIDWWQVKEWFKENKLVNKYEVSPIKYYVRNKQLVAYCDINFRKYIKDNILKKIIIGPKSKVTENDIYYYLFAMNFDPDTIAITNSTATYR